VAAFARWSAGERVADAARQRTRERWLRQQAAESATLAGVLTDLAERRAEVSVATRSQRLSGQVVGVAEDFCVLEERSGAGALVALEHLSSVSATGGDRVGGNDAAGARRPPLSLRLADALSLLAGDRSPVLVTVTSGERVLGQLVAVGADLITMRALGGARGNGPGRYSDLSIPLGAVEVCAPR
jgi:hypothetical protein